MTYSTDRNNNKETITVFGETLKGESSQYFQAYWCNKDQTIIALSELKGIDRDYPANVQIALTDSPNMVIYGYGNTIPEAEEHCRRQLEELSKKAKKLAKKGLK